MRTPRLLVGNGRPRFTSIIHVILITLTLISALGLDYIRWKKGEQAYLFSALERKKEIASGKKRVSERKEAVTPFFLEALAKLGIRSETVSQFKDDLGILHLKVDLPLEKYTQVERPLADFLKKQDFRILKKEEQQTKDKSYYLWEIEGETKLRLSVLFACRKDVAETTEEPPLKPARNKVAIIIDDMGYNLDAINKISAIGKPVTVAIIPSSPLALETANISKHNNMEIILHLPLESINNNKNHIEGMIYAGMSEEDIIKTVEKNLSQVPYIRGVNNHMGSKITANSRLMHIILKHLKERNLFFIDSRTTGNSVAYGVAQSLGIPSAFRHVFLDSKLDEKYIKGQLLELFRQARKNGFALGICHPSEETLSVLKDNFHLIEDYNLEPVFASQVVQ